ncbi:MAG TPA: YbaK/EbsC family protein [Acidobacteriota bacterium]|nr:YbaK/EbsC family protein [Acidobacteriota bacterium]
MTTLERLLEYLDTNHVEYLHTTHETAYKASEVACAEHMPPCSFAKSVVFHTDLGFGMAVLPADCLLNLNDLRAALSTSHARLATEEELERLFPECEVGAMPPVGGLFGLTVHLESGMAADATIAFNAGTHRDVIHMRFQDYEALVKPAFIPIAKPMMAHA